MSKYYISFVTLATWFYNRLFSCPPLPYPCQGWFASHWPNQCQSLITNNWFTYLLYTKDYCGANFSPGECSYNWPVHVASTELLTHSNQSPNLYFYSWQMVQALTIITGDNFHRSKNILFYSIIGYGTFKHFNLLFLFDSLSPLFFWQSLSLNLFRSC